LTTIPTNPREAVKKQLCGDYQNITPTGKKPTYRTRVNLSPDLIKRFLNDVYGNRLPNRRLT
jgi:hypothetical protein